MPIPSSSLEADLPPPVTDPAAWQQFARAPLVPIALAVTCGLMADRWLECPPALALLAAVAGIMCWALLRNHPDRRRSAIPILVVWAGLAAAYHHGYRNSEQSDDLRQFLPDRPGFLRIRGQIDEEPVIIRMDRDDPFIPSRKPDRAATVIQVHQVFSASGWRSASGRIRLTIDRAIDPREPSALDGLELGDEIEVMGFAFRPPAPGNPGETDMRELYRDRRITAELRVSKVTDAVVRLETTPSWSPAGILSGVRRWAGRSIDRLLAERHAAIARALLLGDGSAMDRSEWDEYVRTGVVHVLAISGQHLVVLAGFLWLVARILHIRRRHTAWLVLIVIVGYAAVTGLRPSAVRATVMVSVACAAVIARQPLNPANGFALSWIVVTAINPTDPFSVGCQLSFLSVFVLIWGASRWLQPRPRTAAERLADEFRPIPFRILRGLGRLIVVLYLVNLILFLVNAPLIAHRVNLISPVTILIGPPLIVLTEVALITGFLMLAVCLISPWLATPLAFATEWLLRLSGWLVRHAAEIPFGAVDLPSPPVWWLAGIYLVILLLILVPSLTFRRRAIAALIAWAAVLALLPITRTSTSELRITFLAVGHGGCTVVECPDGHVLVYDAGSMTGPDIIRRSVAPFLWSRGIRRIDDLILSHADIDHYNAVAQLLKRFPVGRVSVSPSFAEKPTAEVAALLLALRDHGLSPHIVLADDRFEAGDVRFEILHPPSPPIPGTENENSLVIAVMHRQHTILLTGDLEKRGTLELTRQPPLAVDVLMAPHHGSRAANLGPLAAWARPRFVAVSRGPREDNALRPGDIGAGTDVWDTDQFGAITVRSHETGLTAEAYRSGERTVIRRGR